MLILGSNGIKSEGWTWYGIDSSTINYPAVSSCVTITCVVSKGLAGIHLASMTSNEIATKDLAEFGKIAWKPSGVYLFGMLSKRWMQTSASNRTELTYATVHGGTLISEIRRATGFRGVVGVYDTSKTAEEVDITAQLTGQTVEFSIKKSGLEQDVYVSFQQLGGDVLAAVPSRRASRGCAIL